MVWKSTVEEPSLIFKKKVLLNIIQEFHWKTYNDAYRLEDILHFFRTKDDIGELSNELNLLHWWHWQLMKKKTNDRRKQTQTCQICNFIYVSHTNDQGLVSWRENMKYVRNGITWHITGESEVIVTQFVSERSEKLGKGQLQWFYILTCRKKRKREIRIFLLALYCKTLFILLL